MTISIRNAPGYALTRPSQVTKVRNVVGYALTLPSDSAVVAGGDVDYRKSRSEILYQLLLKTNPKFSAYTPSSLEYESVTAIAASDLNGGGLSLLPDTTVSVKGSATAGMIGKVTAKYRRIDIAKLFKGRTLSLTVPWTSASTITKATFIDLFAQQFGVRFDTTDITFDTVGFDANFGITMPSTSWCWKGTITVINKKAKRNISDLIGDRKLNTRNWPQAMIDFQDGSKPQGELLYYHLDFSSQRSDFSAWTVNYVYNGSGSGIMVIANAINAVLTANGVENITGASKVSVKPGIDNIKLMRYALPNAAVPEANSAEFSWCLVLEPQETAWFFGKLILHYN